MDESMFSAEAERGTAVLRRAAQSWATDADHLEDLVQQAWLTAWENRSSFRGDGDFLGWLVAIGRSVFSRDWKRRRRERTEGLSEAIHDESAPEHLSVLRAEARDIRDDALINLIVQLPERQRAIVIAHHGFGMPVKRIAEMLERSPETVKATLAQARKKLRGQLSNRCRLEGHELPTRGGGGWTGH